MINSKQMQLLKTCFWELMKYVNTSIPGYVETFDTDSQLATLRIGINKVNNDDTQEEHTPLIQCPVQFSGGGGWSVEHELNSGDEGIILFSQRCIDGWLQTGGTANNPILRFHDMQDAYFIPGIRSTPNVITNFQNNGIRLRNSDASVYHWIKDDGSIESVNSAGYIKLLSTGIADINGVTITPDGAVTAPVSVSSPEVAATTTLTVAGSDYSEHAHLNGTYTAGSTSVTGVSGVPE